MDGRIHLGLGICVLAAQLVGIASSRMSPERYFCWAPYDIHTAYTIEVRVDGRELTPSEIERRYRKPKRARDNRSPYNIIDVIRRVERGRLTGGAEVVLRYQVNGKTGQVWRWPEP
jgi:hypothetical protein